MARENHSTAQRNRPLEGEMTAFVCWAGGASDLDCTANEREHNSSEISNGDICAK